VNLRPIGTCEHIWSAWRPVAEMEYGRRHLIGATREDMDWRECDLCWGYQFASDVEDRAVWERRAIEADLTGAIL
jgi:hypothetical protein